MSRHSLSNSSKASADRLYLKIIKKMLIDSYFVYILVSANNPDKFYVGLTQDLGTRLKAHNAGQSIHTKKYTPWKISVSIGFSDLDKAKNFELYLKSGSGRAFAKKHF